MIDWKIIKLDMVFVIIKDVLIVGIIVNVIIRYIGLRYNVFSYGF